LAVTASAVLHERQVAGGSASSIGAGASCRAPTIDKNLHVADDELLVLLVEASNCFDQLLVRHCSRAGVRRATWQTSTGVRLEIAAD
jgi:hypothetical protein